VYDLGGKTVLITGASSGFGAHFARVFAEARAHLILAARRREPLEAVASECRRLAHGSVISITLDVADAASVAAAAEHFASVDVVVNNAGVVRSAPALEQREEDWDAVVDTNLKGAFLVAGAAARAMRAAGKGGSIINVASILGVRQTKGVLPYAVSKAGIIQMTKVLALELARYEIRVNALVPGYFDTELNHDYWNTAEGQALIKRVPLRRLGRPEDLDGPLLLLASEGSRFMTGSVIEVDGGHLVSAL
jgi:NAD(P)-dependent dehydrogenase (short-subunit alcohol dehydrogenase family)